jgi:ferrous iron transport protein B
MRIALAGQPNCGKSTVFNSIAGYKAITSNFPGTTVKYAETRTYILGHICNCIDLPGTYSLTAADPAELETRTQLLSGEVDVIINVIDASLLCRSLELTLQLLELEIPMVLCLNMMDEAQRKGIQIDGHKLSSLLGIPIIPTIATTGRGMRELFNEAVGASKTRRKGETLKFNKDVEAVIDEMVSMLHSEWRGETNVPSRFLAIKLLERDRFFARGTRLASNLLRHIGSCQEKLEGIRGVPSDEVISSERHALAMNLFEKTSAVIHPPKRDIRIAIDHWVMHKFFGYVVLVAVLYGFFHLTFGVGGYIEEPLIRLFGHLIERLEGLFDQGSLSLFLSKGVLQGIAGGIAIVLPYLVLFLMGLSILEDTGYLPRVAFLMDVFMHRIGLHGKSIIPFILGYGCTVPAVMATRMLEFSQHRFVCSILTTMIPCAARVTIIFGLVAFFISPNAALAIFALNILVVAVCGKILSAFYSGAGLGLILEIPSYQLPPLRNTLRKSWYRIREFIVIAWPILIVGSVLLSVMEYGHMERHINLFLSPLTRLLGLPVSVGTPLIFGLLRKELSLVMLTQALGTTQVVEVMTKTQIMVFAVFVTFYVPCLATIAALWKEIGKRGALLAALITLSVATMLALSTRMFLGLFQQRGY